ncbi:unnamed protein product, partial [Adineta steineri]
WSSLHSEQFRLCTSTGCTEVSEDFEDSKGSEGVAASEVSKGSEGVAASEVSKGTEGSEASQSLSIWASIKRELLIRSLL